MTDVKTEKVKTVKGPKAAVAEFIRARDSRKIFVFCRRGESTDNAIKRVMAANGSSDQTFNKIVN